ncbi:MAG: hypothetical protein ACE5RJ_01265 [Nitrosopumilaceae archaeon]
MRTLTLSTIVFLAVTITLFSLSQQAIAQNQMGMNMMSPRQQWMTINDINELNCRDDLVLMTKANGTPACVSPHAYFRLVDRGWGHFDDSLYVNRQQMMQNLMGHMVRDPGLMQPMHQMILQDQQQVIAMTDLWYDSVKQNPQVMSNFMMSAMNNTDLRQQMIDSMIQNPQMMQAMKGNNQIMGMMQGGSMMGQGQMMGGPMMGQGMMGQNMMSQPLVGQHMTMRNPDVMNNMMNQMMQNPQMMQHMHDMMLQNPYHMQRMMGSHMTSTVGPMMNPMMEQMMNDPEIREQMFELMMQHQEFMQSMIDNQQLQQQLNP